MILKINDNGTIREFDIAQTTDVPNITATKSGTTTTIYKNGTSIATILDGANGSQGEKGDKGDTGATGPAGQNGQDGTDGQDGHTPVKGTDYWTASDKADIIDEMLRSVPVQSVNGMTGAVTGLQTTAITDADGYFGTDTVEAALQQLGATVDGIETLLAAI